MKVAIAAAIKMDKKATVSDLNQRVTNRLKLESGLINAEQLIQIQTIDSSMGTLTTIPTTRNSGNSGSDKNQPKLLYATSNSSGERIGICFRVGLDFATLYQTPA